MNDTGKMQLATPTDREIVVTRVFDAPRHLVFDAFTRPELLKRWLFGPGGWSMVVCEVDLKVGGAYRYVWRHTNGAEMGMGGRHEPGNSHEPANSHERTVPSATYRQKHCRCARGHRRRRHSHPRHRH